jgi:hypothetical protein
MHLFPLALRYLRWLRSCFVFLLARRLGHPPRGSVCRYGVLNLSTRPPPDFRPGIFFTAAFFGIYSEALLSMDGANIRKWIDKVLSGEPNWFNLIRLPLSTPHSNDAHDFLSGDLEESGGAQVTWESFTRGWIHTAASEQTLPSCPLSHALSPTGLKANTPQGFTEAFEDMESWALASSELIDEFDDYDSPHSHHGGVSGSSHGSEKTVDRIKAKGLSCPLPLPDLLLTTCRTMLCCAVS